MFFFCVAHVVKGKNLSEKGMDIFGKGLFGNGVQSLGGGFKHFLCSSLLGEDDPISLIFFKWVGSTANQIIMIVVFFPSLRV